MNIQGNEVSYEQYQYTNNSVKQAIKQSGGRVTRIENITQGKDALSDIIQLEGMPQGTVIQLIVATMSGQIAVNNPSVLDGWRGWNCKKDKLTDEEYNALSKYTSRMGLDQVVDVYQLEDGTDGFWDFEENTFIPLKDGLQIVYEAKAYPYEHDGMTKKEGQLIDNLFKKYRIH